jgi:membrane associated rhomboid family serine protease
MVNGLLLPTIQAESNLIMLSLTLIIIIITVFVSWRAFENPGLFEKLLNNPYQIKHRKQYYRIFSHALIHADWIHLSLNMFVFWSFGQWVEVYFVKDHGLLGEVYFLILYALGAAFATLPSLRKHGDNYGYNSVGASGAVSAVMILAMFISPLSKILFLMAIPMPAYMGILVFFAFEHFMNRSGKTNIAHDAHIWGALFGILFIMVYDIDTYKNFFSIVRNQLFG